MSSTSSSRVRMSPGLNSHFPHPLPSALRAPIMLDRGVAALRPRSPRRRPGRPARTRPESDGPTRAGARCTTAGCSPSSRSRSSPSSSARTSVRAVAHRGDRRLGQRLGVRRTTGRSGTARSPRRERSPCGTVWRVRLDLVEQARRLPAARRSSCAPRSGRGRAASSVSSSSADAGTPSRNASLSVERRACLRRRGC